MTDWKAREEGGGAGGGGAVEEKAKYGEVEEECKNSHSEGLCKIYMDNSDETWCGEDKGEEDEAAAAIE